MKKIWKFLSSMRFAMVLLLVIALACAGGSLIQQGQTLAAYTAEYGERTARLIMALGLDDVFHSWWLLVLTGFLCCSLLLCNLTRLRPLVQRSRAAGGYQPGQQPDVQAMLPGSPEEFFARLRFPRPVRQETPAGTVLCAAKHRIGIWGAWVCHLGVLLLILGVVLGHMTKLECSVYGVPGQTKPIGDTGLLLTVDAFGFDRDADGMARNYCSRITVSDGSTEASAQTRVNHPADLYGMRFYQNSTGWAATVTVTQSGVPVQQQVLCVGEFTPVENRPELVLLFNQFYPDYVMLPGQGPATQSAEANNPAYLYTLYYQGEVLGMNVLQDGETITVDEFTITFSAPQSYTLIQVKQDRFTPLVLLGGLVVLAGLFLAFYLQPKKIWAIRTAAGWQAYGVCRKGGSLFREQFLDAAGQTGAPPVSP